jgi:2,4-dienoyl-CoA reductase-like NADH-dependent reductase (Old Yellow Enzyme family)
MEWRSFNSITTDAYSPEEITALRDKFIRAAERAKKAGYDGVQLHACHGYLLNQFVSPTANRRTDAYGGNTKSRTRFVCEIIRGIHDACGRDFIVSARTTVAEPSLEEACAIADAYIESGIDYLQTSTGIATLEPDKIGCPKDIPYNCTVWAGTALHRHVAGRVPVSVVNGILSPALANYIIGNDLADTVDAARALLADPAWAKAVTDGADYIKCRDCKSCFWSPFMPHRCPAAAQRHQLNPDDIDYRG